MELLKRQKSKKVVTVEEIHDEFDNAVDALVERAKEIIAQETQEDLEIAKKLNSIGFGKAQNIKPRVEAINLQELSTRAFEKAIYYQNKYGKKFITEGQVKAICKKYGLVMGSPSHFIGEIPKANAKEVVNFEVDEEDRQYYRELGTFRLKSSYKEYEAFYSSFLKNASMGAYVMEDSQFKVVGTLDQFDLENKIISDYVIKDKDPIILYPVDEGYLIVTKWGNEANFIL